MKWLSAPKHVFTRCANHLLPTQCLLCGCTLHGDLLCEGCTFNLPWVTRHEYICIQCGLALTTNDSYCGYCLKYPPAYSRSHIPFDYEHPMNSLILGFKYRRHLSNGKLLGNLLAQHIQNCSIHSSSWQTPDLIIPVPLHWSRRWVRGFNQAEVLGQYITQTTKIPLATGLIRRTARTISQKDSTRKERQRNLRHAFSISPEAQKKLENQKIALIDDVVTTTATARELSQLLIKAGAKDVQIWALARTMEK